MFLRRRILVMHARPRRAVDARALGDTVGKQLDSAPSQVRRRVVVEHDREAGIVNDAINFQRSAEADGDRVCDI